MLYSCHLPIRKNEKKEKHMGVSLMKEKIVKHILDETVEGKHTFPAHLLQMMDAEVAGYSIDLLNKKAYYYDENNRIYEVELPYEKNFTVSENWVPEDIKKALLEIQNKKISYIDFLHAIAQAGVVLYEVQIEGSQVVYYAKAKRESYVERFPAQLQDLLAKQKFSS
jgi:uncharacterized protein YbcV (DUF1398 family)